MEIKNAIIEKAYFETERWILSAWIHLNYGNMSQAFGGYALYLPNDYNNNKNQLNYAGHFIWRVLKIAEVGDWEKLKNRPIRVKCDYTKVISIGHIIKDDWFSPEDEFELMRSICKSKKLD